MDPLKGLRRGRDKSPTCTRSKDCANRQTTVHEVGLCRAAGQALGQLPVQLRGFDHSELLIRVRHPSQQYDQVDGHVHVLVLVLGEHVMDIVVPRLVESQY